MNDTISYLRKYIESKRLIQSLLDDIEQRTTTINAVCKPLSNMDVQRSGDGNSGENRMVQFIDMKSKKYLAIKINTIICIQVEHSILRMPDRIHRTILYEHYIRGKSFRTISEETGLYCMKICRLHREALDQYVMINNTVHSENTY